MVAASWHERGLCLRGIVKGAPPDMTQNHDKYVYARPDE